ncbi:hypothetical protein Nepgr_032049 [Nepenthes gracilis]|uniref:Uncharacterized protein n=1 Tax=Nepenthes gracilis TaxID=150966 RepID=A0AAD3TJA1_NEPGR|nr:hypothetical protein Nepgr_032049 [Nepenthes gracilis]
MDKTRREEKGRNYHSRADVLRVQSVQPSVCPSLSLPAALPVTLEVCLAFPSRARSLFSPLPAVVPLAAGYQMVFFV